MSSPSHFSPVRVTTLKTAVVVTIASLGLMAGAASLVVASPAGAGTKTVVVKTEPTALGKILATSSGFTLYRFTQDTATKVACTGACASVWPPLVLPSGAKVTGLRGLGTIKDPGGARQVTYHGHPLYRYSGDTGPGQTHGQGVEGSWFVVKSSTGASTSAGSTSSTSKSGGYGY